MKWVNSGEEHGTKDEGQGRELGGQSYKIKDRVENPEKLEGTGQDHGGQDHGRRSAGRIG